MLLCDFQKLRQHKKAFGQPVGQDTQFMPVGIKTGKQGGHAGAGEGGISIGIVKNNPVFGKPINIGGGVTVITVYSQVERMATIDQENKYMRFFF